MRKHPDARSSELVTAIMDAVGKLIDPSAPSDDGTVVAVRFTGAEERLFEAHSFELTAAAA